MRSLYGPTYLYQQGICGYAGGTEYVSCGLSMGQAFGGPIWRGFCLCGWGSQYWRGVKREITDELTAHAGYKAWGALAHSRAIGRGCVSWAESELEVAKRQALSSCQEYYGPQAADAQILTWGCNRYIAVAKSHNGHIGFANSLNQSAAERGALEQCLSYDRDSKVVSVVHTISGTLYTLERPFG